MSAPWPYSKPAEPGDPNAVKNLPSPEGAELGAMLARMVEQELAEHPQQDRRCEDCAFRRGTGPNQMAPTLMDAVKCLVESDVFYCHHGQEGQEPPCAGWALLRRAGERDPP